MKKLFHRTRTYRSCRHCRRKTWQHSLFLVYTVFSRNLLLLHWHLWTCFQKLAAGSCRHVIVFPEISCLLIHICEAFSPWLAIFYRNFYIIWYVFRKLVTSSLRFVFLLSEICCWLIYFCNYFSKICYRLIGICECFSAASCLVINICDICFSHKIRVITKLPNTEQSSKGKGKTDKIKKLIDISNYFRNMLLFHWDLCFFSQKYAAGSLTRRVWRYQMG